MGSITTVPETNNARIRGYHYLSGEWKAVAVDASGELAVHVEVSDIVTAKISGQQVRLDGYYSTSGDWRPVHVDASGEIKVEAVAEISGGSVFVASGEVHVVSGDIGAQVSGSVIVSGDVQVSGVVVVTSGAVAITSGEMDVVATSGLLDVHAVSGAVAITSGEIDAVVTSGVVVAYTSGQQSVLLGEDYAQASGCVASGAVAVIKTVTAIQEVVKSGEDITPETRLLTGADNKHIRFHDIFDGSELMDQKWDTVEGTIVVTDKFAKLEDAVTATTIQTHDMFQYGTLSCRVYMEDPDAASLRFGFVGEYAISTKDAIVEWNAQRFHTENAAQTMGDTYTSLLGIVADTWYDIQIIWTPMYAQLWVNGELKATHTDNVPQAPARIYFSIPANLYTNIEHVSLTAYGDIPITNQGRVPVREQGNRLVSYKALEVTTASGGMVLGSGQVDRVIVKVPKFVKSGDGPRHAWSGATTGIWVGGASGDAPYCGSGYVASGKGLYLEPGEQKELYVRDLSEVYVVAEVSGDPITYVAEAGTRN